MSKAIWLTPKDVKEQHPNIYDLFFSFTDGRPERANYDNGRQYAKAIAEWIKTKNVKMEL